MKLLIAAILLLALQPCHAKPPIPDGWLSISLVRVLAHPEKFNGKRILVQGYYRSDLEHSALYLTESDAKMPYYDQGIWIGGPKHPDSKLEYPKRGWVRVLGTFRYRAHDGNPTFGSGHMGLWFAEIHGVEMLSREKLTR